MKMKKLGNILTTLSSVAWTLFPIKHFSWMPRKGELIIDLIQLVLFGIAGSLLASTMRKAEKLEKELDALKETKDEEPKEE